MATRQNVLTAIVVASGLLLPLASLRPVSGSQSSPSMAMPVSATKPLIVVVDAGHGGQDTGVIGLDGTREKDIDLAIAEKLKDTLAKGGARVITTRTGDTYLPVMARPALEAANGVQYFVSIHCNRRGPANTNSGVVVYYHGTSIAGRLFATDVLTQIKPSAALPSAGVLSDTTRFQKGFGILRSGSVPGVLVECGFMNNTRDLAALRQGETQQRIADGIAAGVQKFNADYSSPGGLKAKIDFVTAVHAYNQEIASAWRSVGIGSIHDFYQALVQRRLTAASQFFAPHYTLNGHLVTSQEAARLLQATRPHSVKGYHMESVIVNPRPKSGRLTLVTTAHWKTADAQDRKEFTRRDAWEKTSAGWLLATSDVR